jgi:hypothetical protein
MINAMLSNYRFNGHIIERLVKDVAEDQKCLQIHGYVNHPAWTVGHLALASDHAMAYLGLPRTLNDYDAIFDHGTKPTPNVSDYPPLTEILAAYQERHRAVEEGLRAVDPSVIEAETPQDYIRQAFPRIADFLNFLLTTHEGTHHGELIIWRKLVGLPRVSHD